MYKEEIKCLKRLNKIEEFVYPEKAEITGYKPCTEGHTKQVERAVELCKVVGREIATPREPYRSSSLMTPTYSSTSPQLPRTWFTAKFVSTVTFKTL